MAIPNLRPIITYSISFLIAISLLVYVYKDINLNDMAARLKNLDYSWVILSVLLSIISHFARAYRWNLLIKPFGYSLNVFRTFMAVMIGYFANIILPRMGEITKCAVLKRTDKVPLTLSLGTVVAERALDFLVLLSLLTFTIIMEYSLLKDFIFGFFINRYSDLGANLFFVYILLGVSLFILIVLAVFRKKLSEKIRSLNFLEKVKTFLKELGKGLGSIKNIENKFGFWSATLIIWAMYYLMAYVVIFALPQTAGLSLMAGLTILVMGGLGMAAPVQGGIGTYHALVSSVLVLYGIKETDGVLFATILHTTQTIAVLVVGGCCILAISFNERAILADINQEKKSL